LSPKKSWLNHYDRRAAIDLLAEALRLHINRNQPITGCNDVRVLSLIIVDNSQNANHESRR
jgi:hypothetical protein